jgi:hypothetical protein
VLLLLAALIAGALTVQLLGGGRGHGVRPSELSECSRTLDRLTPRALRRFCDDPFGHAPRGARARAWPPSMVFPIILERRGPTGSADS